MAKVVMTWELGAGIGHLMNLRPIGQELIRRGHQVIAIVRDLSAVEQQFMGTGIRYVAAPIVARKGSIPFEPPQGFAHVLGNIGWNDDRIITTAFSAWNTLFDELAPDLVVADHSPTALLALRGKSIPCVNIGLGFFCPPDHYPLPRWSSHHQDSTQVVADEDAITERINRLLASQRRPGIQRISQVFNEISAVMLATYAEFDHYGVREGMRYWGHWPFAPGVDPNWPSGSGPKIYAYLKSYPGLERMLSALRDRGTPTLVLSNGIDPVVQQRYQCTSLRFESNPLDLRPVATQCDLAILNGNHGTAAAMLLSGKPCLLAPIYLEQLLFSRKAEQTGSVRVLSQEVGATVASVLADMLTSGQYRAGAQAFSARHSQLAGGAQIPELTDHLERLLRPGPHFLVRSAQAANP